MQSMWPANASRVDGIIERGEGAEAYGGSPRS
jgi:hypothetical protein